MRNHCFSLVIRETFGRLLLDWTLGEVMTLLVITSFKVEIFVGAEVGTTDKNGRNDTLASADPLRCN
jgi:hypothetical protein